MTIQIPIILEILGVALVLLLGFYVWAFAMMMVVIATGKESNLTMAVVALITQTIVWMAYGTLRGWIQWVW